jgi:N-acyl homoserine lactone hydrolase
VLLSTLPTGSYESPAALAFRGGSREDTRHFAAPALRVRHPKGNLLIDAGFGKNVDEHLKLIPAMQRSTHAHDATAFRQIPSVAGVGPLTAAIPRPRLTNTNLCAIQEYLDGISRAFRPIDIG